jgi:hypothetical protein
MGRKYHLSVLYVLLLLCAPLLPIQADAGWSHDPAVNTAITTQVGADTGTAITDDASGGAIIAWTDPSNNIRVQKIDANGNLLWGANGKPLTSGENNYYPQIVTDMSGGAFIVWQKGSSGDGIYVQQVDGDGDGLWSIGDQMVVVNGGGISGKHRNPRIVSDGQQGVIVVWEDSRSAGTTGFDIYAQRYFLSDDGDGYYEWSPNGVEICAATGDQLNPQQFSDNNGGVVFVWQDQWLGKWKIMALRVDVETGSPSIGGGWSYNGNPVSFSDQEDNVKPQITGDGSGGAIISWQVGNDGSGGIYAQRISISAEYPWFANQLELIVSAGQNKRQNPQIISDGSGGAIISWLGVNSSNGTSTGIYAQRIDGSGTVKWITNGVTVASPSAIDTGVPPQIVSDGSNGAIIAWSDQRNGSDYNVYSQRISGTNGSAQWTSNGALVSTAANDQRVPRMIGDSGGAIIVWQDQRSADGDIYAQKVLADGSLPIVVPTVTTTEASEISFTTAKSGGNVTIEGGASVTARGVCWGTSANPASNCISAGSGTGSFSGVISGLTPATPYHVRAYATNSAGTSYGDDLQFTTVAGSTLTLGLTLNGGATGRVTSDPVGIDCTSSQCNPVIFAADTKVTLTGTPDSDSTLVWGGDCEVLNGKCSITMNGARSATASFNYVQTVRILGSASPFTLIGDAYAGLPGGGGTIQARVHEFTETLNLNRSINAILKGGYDTAYSGNSGLTTVKGKVTVASGRLTVENLIIK